MFRSPWVSLGSSGSTPGRKPSPCRSAGWKFLDLRWADGCCEVKAPLVINRCCFLVQNIGHVTHGVIQWDPWKGGIKQYKSRVILRDFPKLTMKCLGWCPVMTHVTEEFLFFFPRCFFEMINPATEPTGNLARTN